jgi:flagellar protein FlbT
MPLKISLKPQERLYIGGAVVINGEHRCNLTILNDVPILRKKDIMTEAEAHTPCRRLYFLVQLMYIDRPNLDQYRARFSDMARDVLTAAPSTVGLIQELSDHVTGARYYQALKSGHRLIEYEEELIDHAKSA